MYYTIFKKVFTTFCADNVEVVQTATTTASWVGVSFYVHSEKVVTCVF